MAFDERQWSRLLTDIKDRVVIPVIGPDVVVLDFDGDRTTLQTFLAKQLLSRLNFPADAPRNAAPDLSEVIARYLGQKGSDPEELYYEIGEILNGRALPTPQPLARLAAITHFDLYLSTTFDTLLQQALDETRFGGRKETSALAYSKMKEVVDLPEEFEAEPATTVYQIYGRIDPAHDYALTEEDIVELTHRIQARDRRPQNLFDQLRTKQLLVIGCSFPGWLSRFFLRAAKGTQLLTMGARGFVADEATRRDPGLVMFLERRKTIVYSEGTVLDFVDELHRRWTEKYGQPAVPPADGEASKAVMPAFAAESIFISYASEDRPSAMSVKASLESAGLDVWIDQGDLEPGDDYREKILANIEHCSFFVPLISRNTLSEDRRFFRLEWRKAIDEAQFRPSEYPFIQPVVIDDTATDAPYLPREFRERHWNRLQDSRLPEEFIQCAKERIRQRRRERRSA